MSLEDNCGKFGRTKMIFFVTLPGGLVLCVPGQHSADRPIKLSGSRRAQTQTSEVRLAARSNGH